MSLISIRKIIIKNIFKCINKTWNASTNPGKNIYLIKEYTLLHLNNLCSKDILNQNSNILIFS